jgi:hypothetical protein
MTIQNETPTPTPLLDALLAKLDALANPAKEPANQPETVDRDIIGQTLRRIAELK